MKQQTSNSYLTMKEIATDIVRKEGLRGLYRGVTAPLIGVTPIFATAFWGYDMGILLMKWINGTDQSQSVTMVDKMTAGAFSALPTTVITAPVERVKCILQVQIPGQARYVGMWDCASGLYREAGLRSLFRGWEMTLARDVPGSIAYFGVYEGLKMAWSRPDGSISDLSILTAGGLAGMWCSLLDASSRATSFSCVCCGFGDG